MATFAGSAGIILVGSTALAEVRSYSIDETMDTLEDTAMGDTSRTFKPSLKNFSGSADVFFDDTDSNGQGALKPGSTAVLKVHMEGAGSGKHQLTGNILVVGRTISASFDGMVEASISFTGNGALTEDTI